jgi:type II secretory pathway pseudopilin PulG
MKVYKNQFGDTIVEVMIAIVVLGAALGGAFAISNRSTRTTQANHERYQAQVLANSQAERLKSNYNTFIQANTRSSYVAGSTCLNASNNWEADIVNCTIDGLYDIKLEPVPITPPDEAQAAAGSAITYKIVVKWDSLTSGGKDNVELLYGL